ncbi:hypothetical protein ACXM1Q_005505 [Streptococcus sp. 10F2]
MSEVRNEIKIRGLSQKEIEYLKALSNRSKSKSFNEFLLAMCREKIEKEKFNLAEGMYLAYMDDMKVALEHALLLSQKQNIILTDFDKKMDRYAYHISRWLEYEGEISSED